MGIEPTSSAWKAEVLPLNYTRLSSINRLFMAYKNPDSLFSSNRPDSKNSHCVFPAVELPTQSTTRFRLCLAAYHTGPKTI